MLAIIIVIIVIVLILAYFAIKPSKLEDDFLTGTWEATNAFCTKVGMDNMLIQYGKPMDIWGSRRLYIIIYMEGEPIYGNTVKATITRYPEFNDNSDHIVDMSIAEIPDEEGINESVFTDFIPAKMKVKYNLANSTIEWYKDEDVYFKGKKVPKLD